jgi:hypothetical protein
MAKVITFSRVFPKGHIRAGEPTFFVEQIYNSLLMTMDRFKLPDNIEFLKSLSSRTDLGLKHHTIRAGNRFKAGEYFSPRVWSGKPYKSKQVIIAPDIEIKKVWDFGIEVDKDYITVLIDGEVFAEENQSFITQKLALETLAKNDGLFIENFKSWFQWGKPFYGQIICWNDKIDY